MARRSLQVSEARTMLIDWYIGHLWHFHPRHDRRGTDGAVRIPPSWAVVRSARTCAPSPAGFGCPRCFTDARALRSLRLSRPDAAAPHRSLHIIETPCDHHCTACPSPRPARDAIRRPRPTAIPRTTGQVAAIRDTTCMPHLPKGLEPPSNQPVIPPAVKQRRPTHKSANRRPDLRCSTVPSARQYRLSALPLSLFFGLPLLRLILLGTLTLSPCWNCYPATGRVWSWH